MEFETDHVLSHQFEAMDRNDGGLVLFDEFCSYLAVKMDPNADAGLDLIADGGVDESSSSSEPKSEGLTLSSSGGGESSAVSEGGASVAVEGGAPVNGLSSTKMAAYFCLPSSFCVSAAESLPLFFLPPSLSLLLLLCCVAPHR